VVADRERALAELEAKIEQLQLGRERQALKTAELEKTIETLTQQQRACDSAAAEAASRLSDDARQLRLALDDTSRRERQVITALMTAIISYLCDIIGSAINKPDIGLLPSVLALVSSVLSIP